MKDCHKMTASMDDHTLRVILTVAGVPLTYLLVIKPLGRCCERAWSKFRDWAGSR